MADAAAFVSGFQGAFRISAAIPVVAAGLMLLRGWARAR
jgi:hypothetical protein